MKLLVGQVVRFFADYLAAKHQVDAGVIGEPSIVRLSRLTYLPFKGEGNWFHDTEKSGGLVYDLMIHDFDYAIWVAGEVTEVFAKLVSNQDDRDAAAHALVIMRHSSGALSHIEGSWMYPKPTFWTKAEIAGSEGLIKWDSERDAPVKVIRDTAVRGAAVPAPRATLLDSPWITEIRHFAEVLRGNAEARVTGQDALAAVMVCSANNEHLTHVRIAADAGLPIFCEKPLATTLADSAELVAVCDAADVSLMTAFPMRFSPALRAVRSAISAGELGQIRALVGVNQAVVPFRGDSWFSDPVKAGGGAVMDHVVHLADTFRWMLGENIVEVYGQTNRVCHAELEVETGGLVMVTMESGVVATIDCSWSRPDAHPIWGGLEVDVVGSTGVASVNAFAQKLQVSTNFDPHARLPGWGDDLGQLMVEEFVSSIEECRMPLVSGHDGFLATEVTLAVYRSVAVNAPVTVTGC